MKNLDKFYDMFSNLDGSYEKMKSRLGNISKYQFLKKMCFTKDDKIVTPKVKAVLQPEIDSYSNEEKEKYTNVIEALNSLELFFNEHKEEVEIKSLNSIVLESMMDKKELFTDKLITADEVIFNNSIDSITNVKKECSFQLFRAYGEIDSFTKLFKGYVITRLLEENFDNDFITVNSTTVSSLIEAFNKDKSNKFLIQVLNLYNKVPEKYRTGSIAFCSSRHFSKEESKVLGRKMKVTYEDDDMIIVTDRKVFVTVVKSL